MNEQENWEKREKRIEEVCHDMDCSERESSFVESELKRIFKEALSARDAEIVKFCEERSGISTYDGYNQALSDLKDFINNGNK